MTVGPKIIAFEGVDGAGKSTVIKKVADYLRERGERVHLPRSGKEHDSRPTRMIRRVTRDPRNIALDPLSELLLYCAREAQILRESVRPALARGETVLLDRSLLTPVVLGSFGRGLDRETCERAAKLASAGVEPDLTLVFDVHPRTSRLRKRIEKVRKHASQDKGRKGLSGSGLKERVREGYGKVARERGYPVFHVERITPDVLSERVIRVLEGGPVEERPDELVPNWMVPPEWSLDQALDSLPAAAAVCLSRRLAAARELRARAFDEEPTLVAWALDRDDPLRERSVGVDAGYALAGLAGRPMQDDDLRAALAEQHPAEVLSSLRAVEGEAADELRSRLAQRAPGAAVASVAAREDEFAEQLRAKHWKEANAYERATSLVGCNGEEAWRRRTEVLESHAFVGLTSLKRVDPQRAEPWLERYAELAPKPVLSTLMGRSDPLAHAWRRRLADTGREVVDTLRGLDDEASWQLRDELCEKWPSTVAHSLLGIEPGPRLERMLARCKDAGAGDIHLLRRLTQLREYRQWPEWAKRRRDAESDV